MTPNDCILTLLARLEAERAQAIAQAQELNNAVQELEAENAALRDTVARLEFATTLAVRQEESA